MLYCVRNPHGGPLFDVCNEFLLCNDCSELLNIFFILAKFLASFSTSYKYLYHSSVVQSPSDYVSVRKETLKI